MSSEGIQPHQLSIEQLNALRQQHEEELSELGRQLESLQEAKNRFITARVTLDDISSSSAGSTLLVPLSSSLYVPGKIDTPDKVMIELGTGYFCEKTIPDAKALCDRKMQLISNSMESIENVGTKKRRTMEQIIQVMQYKMEMSGGR